MESPPTLSCYVSQSAKERVFPGSSSTCMEADVVEISPPANPSSKLKSLKQKEVSFPEIIDVDMDEDCADIVLVDKEADTNRKGKEVSAKFPPGSSSGTNYVSGNGVQSLDKNYESGSQYLFNEDDIGTELFFGEKEYVDMDDDQYAILQSHFDRLDIPPGVEVPIPWFTGYQENKMKSAAASTSIHSTPPIDLDAVGCPPLSDACPSSWHLEFEQSNDKSTSGGSSSVGAKLKTVGKYTKLEPSPSWLYEDPVEIRKSSTASKIPVNLPSKRAKNSLNFSTKTELVKSQYHSAESWHGKTKGKQRVVYSKLESGSLDQLNGHVPKVMKPLGNGAFNDLASRNRLKARTKANDVQPSPVSHKFELQRMVKNALGHSIPSAPYAPVYIDPSGPLHMLPDDMAFGPWDQDLIGGQKSAATSGNSSGSLSVKGKYGDPDEFLKKFDLFKRFDTVQDFTDHYYSRNGSSLSQDSKSLAKKIQEEWRILENDLPDKIFVRVYESRMDLLRAVIIGAEGTPYHDGLFFFDVFFPSNYPKVPPHVYYHSGGLRINPNLYNCGKVCLSLLNTWSGSDKEMWIPGVSTILQVLVSIQGLILNAKPFFNEPGYANMSGTPKGEKSSLQYNENTLILSLKTMVYSIRKPPKHFENFVAGHFFKCAHDILVACKAYTEGAQVGCLVKGGVQDVDEGDKSCSQHFKDTVAGNIKVLVDAFAEIGVKDCDKFLSLAPKTNRPVSAAPRTINFY